jgi:hypothetical protein
MTGFEPPIEDSAAIVISPFAPYWLVVGGYVTSLCNKQVFWRYGKDAYDIFIVRNERGAIVICFNISLTFS